MDRWIDLAQRDPSVHCGRVMQQAQECRTVLKVSRRRRRIRVAPAVDSDLNWTESNR